MSDPKVDYKAIQFSKNEWGHLILKFADGSEFSNVEPIRCFPLSDPEGAIAILDAQGKELVCLPNLDCLNDATSKTLKQELSEREFSPTIRRIVSTSTPTLPSRWEVETDRGLTVFQLESEDDLRPLRSGAIVVCDSNGVRYTIPSVAKLDSASQRVIRRFIYS